MKFSTNFHITVTQALKWCSEVTKGVKTTVVWFDALRMRKETLKDVENVVKKILQIHYLQIYIAIYIYQNTVVA